MQIDMKIEQFLKILIEIENRWCKLIFIQMINIINKKKIFKIARDRDSIAEIFSFFLILCFVAFTKIKKVDEHLSFDDENFCDF